MLRPLLRQGVAVFKTDFAEGVPADAVAANGMTGTELHNVYSLLFNDAVPTVTQEVAGHAMVWARSSFLGGQRHSAQWGGDTNCSYPAMGSTLRGGLSHGLSGVPFWSHDAGGFTGTPDARPVRAVGPVRRAVPAGAVPRHHQPAAVGLPGRRRAAAVEAVRLRYRLMPYLYSAAVESARTGVPMMRALLVDSPDDPAAWLADLEYRLGPDLLVAPMTDPTGTRRVYLPAGDVGRLVDRRGAAPGRGTSRVTPAAGAGAAVRAPRRGRSRWPRWRDHVGDAPFGPITLRCFDADRATIVIHDVNGDTTVHLDGGPPARWTAPPPSPRPRSQSRSPPRQPSPRNYSTHLGGR